MADADGFVAKQLRRPVFAPADLEAEDEEYGVPRSACYIFDGSDKLVEAHASALDCKQYCCKTYNAGCWPRSAYERTLHVDVVEGVISYKGALIKYLNKREDWKDGMWVAVHHVDLRAADQTAYE